MSVDRDLAERAVRQLVSDAYGAQVVSVEIGQPTKLTGTSIVTILIAGEMRPPFTARGVASEFDIEVNHFVLRSDGTTNWTPRKAEKKLNALAGYLADVIAASMGTRTITINDGEGATSFTSGGIRAGGRSKIVPFSNVGGEVYELESFPLVLSVYGG